MFRETFTAILFYVGLYAAYYDGCVLLIKN